MARAAEAGSRISVTIAVDAAPGAVHEQVVSLATPCSVRDALAAAGLDPLQCDDGDTGVWGRRVALHTPLADGDRVERYRPLRVDPKVARRERFRQQGARGAGLFAQRRPGGKQGY